MTSPRPLDVRLRSLATMGCLFVAALGVWAWLRLPIEAYPDISAQQVLVISAYPGRATEEVERQVTIPIELGMGSVAFIETIRSRTIFGLSVVELIFADGTDTYFARQRVQERLAQVNLPTGVAPELGPLATAYGEVFRYHLNSAAGHSSQELRTLNDWVVIPRLQRASGVAEVINFGGTRKQYSLKINTAELDHYGLTLDNVVAAIEGNNANAGGSVVRRGDQSVAIRGRGAFEDADDLRDTMINAIEGTPVYLRDVADVEIDMRQRLGIFGIDRQADTVEGVVLMQRGSNPSDTLASLNTEVEALNRFELPEGVRVEPFYERQSLVVATRGTVARSLAEGLLLVFILALFYRGSLVATLPYLATVVFAALFMLAALYLAGMPLGLMAVGSLDVGMLLASPIWLGTCLMRHRYDGRRSAVLPLSLGLATAIVTLLPIFTLTDIEGAFLRPVAWVAIFALAGSTLFSVVGIPVLAVWLPRSCWEEWENPLLAWCRSGYLTLLGVFLQVPRLMLGALAAVLVLIAVGLLPRIDVNFLPDIDEGVIWIRGRFPEGLALEQTAAYASQMRELVGDFPEVRYVASQAGRNSSGTEPFPANRLELMVGLRPREEWNSPDNASLREKIGNTLRERFPTARFIFTQPIIDGALEIANGTSADLTIEYSGLEIDALRQLARQTVKTLNSMPQVIDAYVEQEESQPQLMIQANRNLCARYNVRIDAVNRLINTAIGGEPVGTLFEGDRRFDIVARFDRRLLNSPDAIRRLPVFSEAELPIPVAQVADFELVDGLTLVERNGKNRRVTVRCDIAGHDYAGFMTAAQSRLAAAIDLPEGYQARWVGKHENLTRLRSHFEFVVPVALVMIYACLLVGLGSHQRAMIVLATVPCSCFAAAAMIYVLGATLDVASSVGISLLCSLMLVQGLMFVTCFDPDHADVAMLLRIAGDAFTPALLIAIAALVGLLPAALASDLGSDLQRSVAIAVVGGALPAVLLTLLVVPLLWRVLFATR